MAYLGHKPAVGENNSFRILDDISSFVLTFDGSSASVVGLSDETITITENNHRFITGQRVTYSNGGGGNITGLVNGQAYFVINHSKTQIKLASSASNALAGTAVNLTGLGTGSSHTLTLAFDGVNTKFDPTFGNGMHDTLIKRAAQLVISINGVIQQPHDTATPTTGFGVDSLGHIIFSTAPASTDIFWGHILATNTVTFDSSDNDVDTFTGNGSTTSFTLSKIPPDNRNILVTIDGVVQYPSDAANTRSYNVSENVMTFVAAPGLGTVIQVRHIGYAGIGAGGGGGVTGFYGRTGNVSLQSTDNIVANNATFNGNVSIAQTLTYEDVTDIDSVGLITARSGIKDQTLTAGHVVFAGTGGRLSGEADLFYNSSTNQLGIGTVSPDHNLHVHNSSGDSVITIESTGNGNSSALEFMRTTSGGDSKGAGSIYVTGNTGASEAKMQFGAGHNIGHAQLPRMTIMGGGEVGIGTDDPKSKLELDGRFRILDNSDGTPSSGKGLEISYYTSDDLADILSYDRGAAAYKKLQLRGSSIDLKRNNSILCTVGTGGNGTSVGFSTTVNMVTNAERIAVRGYSSFKSTNPAYAAIYLGSEGSTDDTANQLLMFNAGGANRGGIGYVPNTGELRFNHQYFMTFCTGAQLMGGTERLRIMADGDIEFGVQDASTAITGGTPIKNFDLGRDYWNGTKGDYRALRLRIYDNGNIDDMYGLGVSSGQLEIQSQGTIGFYASGAGSSTGRRVLAMTIDTGQRLLLGHTSAQEVYGTAKLQIQGTTGATSSLSLLRHGNSPYLTLGSTGGNALGAVTALADDARIGQITFAGADGTDVNTHSASIAAYVDGSVSSNTVPGRLTFQTSTGASEVTRMAILSDGTIRGGSQVAAQPAAAVAGFQFDAGGEYLRISKGGGATGTSGAGISIIGGGSNTNHLATTSWGSNLFLINSNQVDNNSNAVVFANKNSLASSMIIGKNDSHASRYGSLIFATSYGSSPVQRMRITRDGSINIGTDSTQSTHMLYMQGTGSVGIHLRADTDNSGENDNPYLSMAQDSGNTQQFKVGLAGDANTDFNMQLANSPFVHANNGNSQPLQFAHMTDMVATLSSVSTLASTGQSATDPRDFFSDGSLSGNAVGGLKIQHYGNDTAAALMLCGHNNTGTPGAETGTQLTHTGANLRFHIEHHGIEAFNISPSGNIYLKNCSTIPSFTTSYNVAAISLKGGSLMNYQEHNIYLLNNMHYDGSWKNTYAGGGGMVAMGQGALHHYYYPDDSSAGNAQTLVRSVSIYKNNSAGSGLNTGNRPSAQGTIIIWGHSDQTTAGGIEFHSSGGGGAGYGSKITTQSNGTMQFHCRSNNSAWSTYLTISSQNGQVSGNLNDTSDISLKRNVESISTSCIDNIKKLNPVSFEWKAFDSDEKQIGFIAQEVEKVIPEAVKGEDGEKALNVTGIVAQLTKALQESITKIETLEAKVAALEGS